MRKRSIVGAVIVAASAAAPWAYAKQDAAPESYRGWVHELGATAAYTAPAGDLATTRGRNGRNAVTTNGRLLTPAGRSVTVAPHPFGLSLSPDGQSLVTANGGSGPYSVSVIAGLTSPAPVVRQIPPGPLGDSSVINGIFMGLAWAPDNRTLYVSGGNDGSVNVLDTVTGQRTATIDLNVPFGGREWHDGYIGDIAMSPDGRTLWVVDQANFRLVGIDLSTQRVSAVIEAGRYPFGLALTPDGSKAFVANVGAFSYSYVEGYRPADALHTALTFPPFGYGTPAARDGTTVEGKRVPGVGDPNDAVSFSVWAIDLRSGRPVAKLKTGPLVTEKVQGIPAVGGSAPDAVVTDGRRVYVSNNSSDSVAVIDVATDRVVAQVPLAPTAGMRSLRGLLPFGLTLSPDRKLLYVAESGINAVAVVDTQTLEVLGHIPTEWYPAKVALSYDGGTLYVSNGKGVGSGPNGGPGFVPGAQGTSPVTLMRGTVSITDLPDVWTRAGQEQLRAWTAQVVADNGMVAVQPGADDGRGRIRTLHPVRSPIKHVIFVTKENRTFDQVLGDLGSMGNRAVRGDPAISRAPVYGFGEHAVVVGSDGTVTPDVDVTPNQHALARQFSLSDNFYTDSDGSADGHRWLVGVAPNAFVESAWAASYGDQRDFRENMSSTAAPGRRGFTGSNAGMAPEDYAEAGSIWENFARNGVDFRNYGEGFEFADIHESAGEEPTGARLPVNVPMPAPLFTRTARDYPTFNMNISDQFRFGQFKKDFTDRYLKGTQDLPPFTYVYLPQDHTGAARPAQGYTSSDSYVADNDSALGQVVDLVSHSKYWSSTAIFVTEDDAQGGIDSVDAHRTVLLVISPWTKHNYVSGVHASFGSVIKTINLLLGVPFLNQQDAVNASLLDMFTDRFDPAPFQARPADGRVFDAAKALSAQGYAARQPVQVDIDDPEFIEQQHEQIDRVESAGSR